jgi:hypothetical protein
MLDELRLLATLLRLIPATWAARTRREHPDDGSFSTEAVVVTALLVALAIAVMAALGPKVLAKVQSINLG